MTKILFFVGWARCLSQFFCRYVESAQVNFSYLRAYLSLDRCSRFLSFKLYTIYFEITKQSIVLKGLRQYSARFLK